MAFTDPTKPNLADFIIFSQQQGLSPFYLPVDSPYYQWALTYSVNIVISGIGQIPAIQYIIAVYNLAFHWLIENAQDQTGIALASLSWSGGAVTATTVASIALNIGQTFSLIVSGAVPAGYNGTFSQPLTGATVTGTNAFTYPVAVNPGTETSPGTFALQFFTNLRQQFNLLQLVAGPVESSADQGTSQKLLVPDFFANLTFSDLDVMKTPWGRAYLAWAQMAGPNWIEYS